MGDVLKFVRRTPAEKSRGRTMCANNHHKWKVVSDRQFDVKQGKLVTVYQCERCGKQKNRLL